VYCLLGEEAGSEVLLDSEVVDEQTTAGVLGDCTSVDTYTGSSGDGLQDRHDPFETWTVRNCESVDERWYEFVSILEGVTEVHVTGRSSHI